MAKQMTEMLKGTLEGIVLAILAERPAYGYEITARLRDAGFGVEEVAARANGGRGGARHVIWIATKAGGRPGM